MLIHRLSEERGQSDFGWLKAKHSFSFGRYVDRQYMGFETLRVINDDMVAPGAGFATHPHDNMEIITYVLEGALEHKDSMGNSSVIKPGEVQRMSAGTGVEHSEYNHYKDRAVKLLQIWFLPDQRDVTPGYEQKSFSNDEKRGVLKLVASKQGREGSVSLHQDVDMYAMLLDEGDKPVRHSLATGRAAWVQIARGSVTLNGLELRQGDGVAVRDESELTFSDASDAEIILFDMAPLPKAA